MHIVPNGVNFLLGLNIILDVFSFRNLILPFLFIVLGLILKQPPPYPFFCLLLISCANNVASGYNSIKLKNMAVIIAIPLGLALLYFDSIIIITTIILIIFLFFIFLRRKEKLYAENNVFNPYLSQPNESMNNHFLWLDYQIFKKSKHIQFAVVKVIAISLLYCYIISTRYAHESKIPFDLIVLIQFYYSLAAFLIIPYILGSNHSFIGLLMTLPKLNLFFVTKLNQILIFQFSLIILLISFNHNNAQLVLLISSIGIFNILIITPILFFGVFLTDEKINIFDDGINSFLLATSFIQSLYFFFVLILTFVILYLLQTISLNFLFFILIGLSLLASFQKKLLFRLFYAGYQKNKYKVYEKLSK